MSEIRKATTAEILREITGGEPPVHDCGETPCLHGVPEAVGTEEPLTHRPGEYLGLSRESYTGTGDDATAPALGGPHVRTAIITPLMIPTIQSVESEPVIEQPPPTPNRHPAIQDLVMEDLAQRKAVGIMRYGTPLQPHNGRDPLRDLYEELIDAVQYLRQLMYERDGR